MTDRIHHARLPRRAALALAAAAVLAGCTTPPVPTKSELTVTRWSMDISRPLPPDAVVTATLRFHIQDYEQGRYTLAGMFDTTLPNGSIRGGSKDSPIKPVAADGELQVTLRVADMLKDPEIRKPLRVRFLMVKRVSETGGYPVSMTGPIELNTAP